MTKHSLQAFSKWKLLQYHRAHVLHVFCSLAVLAALIVTRGAVAFQGLLFRLPCNRCVFVLVVPLLSLHIVHRMAEANF